MKDVAEKLKQTISNMKPQLLNISNEEASQKSAPNKWSKKEILGHLIDSAANNHQRFVRAVQNSAQNLPGYVQDSWVAVQHYNDQNWEELIILFSSYNYHLANVIKVIPEEASKNECGIGKDTPVTLEFVVKDYLRHLLHHLDKILENDLQRTTTNE